MLTSNPEPLLALMWDKFLHFGAWGLLTTLGYCSCRTQRHFTILTIAIAAYSVLMEVLQPLVAQRFFSLADIAANGLGCITALLLAPRIDRWLAVCFRE